MTCPCLGHGVPAVSAPPPRRPHPARLGPTREHGGGGSPHRELKRPQTSYHQQPAPPITTTVRPRKSALVWAARRTAGCSPPLSVTLVAAPPSLDGRADRRPRQPSLRARHRPVPRGRSPPPNGARPPATTRHGCGFLPTSQPLTDPFGGPKTGVVNRADTTRCPRTTVTECICPLGTESHRYDIADGSTVPSMSPMTSAQSPYWLGALAPRGWKRQLSISCVSELVPKLPMSVILRSL